jgi:hypothetical protein
MVVAWLGWNAIAALTSKPVIVNWGTIEKGFWAEALFVREETVLTAPADGTVITKITSGTRIPQGEVIAIIDSKTRDDDSSATEQHMKLSLRLQQLTKEAQALNEDINRVNGEIRGKQSLLIKRVNQSLDSSQIKEDLITLEKEKGQILRTIRDNQEQIGSLNAKLYGRFGKAIVIAKEPGCFFSQYDEWEGKLTPKQFDTITETDLNRNYALKNVRNEVKAGEIIGKMITPFNQYIMIKADSKLVGKVEPGDIWWVRDHDSLNKTMVDNVSTNSGPLLVTLQDPGVGQIFYPERRTRLYMIYRRVSGVMIPVQALFHNQNTYYVRLMKGDGITEQNVRIIEKDNEHAIVEGIEFGATIISR